MTQLPEMGWYQCTIADPRMEPGYSEENVRLFHNGKEWEQVPKGYLVYHWHEIKDESHE